jgi:hypothetical protein
MYKVAAISSQNNWFVRWSCEVWQWCDTFDYLEIMKIMVFWISKALVVWFKFKGDPWNLKQLWVFMLQSSVKLDHSWETLSWHKLPHNELHSELPIHLANFHTLQLLCSIHTRLLLSSRPVVLSLKLSNKVNSLICGPCKLYVFISPLGHAGYLLQLPP